MDTFDDYYQRKADSFYEKKCLKDRSKKPLTGKPVNFLIVKSNNKKLQRRYQKNSPDDGLVLNVPYSMNRKYRFETMQPPKIAQNISSEGSSLVVHEQMISSLQAKNALKSVYHGLETRLESFSSSGLLLGNTNTLIPRFVTKRSDFHKKGKKNSKNDSREGEVNESKDVTIYTISRCLASSENSSNNHGRKTRARAKNRSFDLDFVLKDYESFPNDHDILTLHGGCGPILRDNDFSKEYSIEEFICQPSKQGDFVVLEGKQEKPKEQMTASSSALRSDVIDLPKEVLNKFRYETSYAIDKWKEFNFSAEAEKIFNILPECTEFSWLTSTHEAFGIRIFEKSNSNFSGLYPTSNIKIELGISRTINICIDGNFTSEYSDSGIRQQLLKSSPTNLEQLVKWCLTSLPAWNSSGCNNSDCAFAADQMVGNKRIGNLEKCESVFEYREVSTMFRDDLNTMNDEELFKRLRLMYEEYNKDDSFGFEVVDHENVPPCFICNTASLCGNALLGCLHNICLSCLRDSLISQLRSDVFPLHCPSPDCTSAVPLDIVQSLLPIPYFIYYIRRSLKNSEKLNGRETACCPACLKIGVISNQIRFQSLRCNKCFVCFCSDCGRPPHWPIKCAEAEYWIEKFKETAKYVKLRLKGELKEKMLVRKCFMCEKELEAGDQVPSVECSCHPWCYYNWKTGEVIIRKNQMNAIFFEGKMRKAEDMPAVLLRKYAPTYFVEAKYCRLWYEAREFRKAIYSGFHVYARNEDERTGLNLPCGLKTIREFETAVYYLMEYGWIWLYIHRSDKNPKWKKLRLELEKMIKIWKSIEEKLKLDTLPEIANRELQRLVFNVDETFRSLIADFKIQ